MLRFARALAALLAVLSVAPVAAAPALWRFGDEDTTIYLFGTIHALPARYSWQDDRIRKAMKAADTLVLETLIDEDPQSIARLFPPPDPTLPPVVERLPARSRPAYETLIAKAKISGAALDRMPSWQVAFVLMGAVMRDLGIARDSGVEDNIIPAFRPAASKAAPKPGQRKVEALETASAQLALFAELSEADQRELLASMIDGRGNAKDDYAKMLSAWDKGDQIAITKLFDEDKDLTPHLREILLRKRNAAWTQWLKARLAVPGTVFVAVGAGHLAGPLSVRAMLEAQGIKIKRVWIDDIDEAATAKAPR